MALHSGLDTPRVGVSTADEVDPATEEDHKERDQGEIPALALLRRSVRCRWQRADRTYCPAEVIYAAALKRIGRRHPLQDPRGWRGLAAAECDRGLHIATRLLVAIRLPDAHSEQGIGKVERELADRACVQTEGSARGTRPGHADSKHAHENPGLSCAPQPKTEAGGPAEVRQQSVPPMTPGQVVRGTHGLIAICPHAPLGPIGTIVPVGCVECRQRPFMARHTHARARRRRCAGEQQLHCVVCAPDSAG